MKEEKEKLFTAPRWKEYQPVEVLKTKVKRTEEDEKKAENFRKFIDKKIEKDTNKK